MKEGAGKIAKIIPGEKTARKALSLILLLSDLRRV